ncbi:MAG: hypothetical protein Q8K96_00710 [Rubrivivax sp.]|nr:hypothetical protein [Rubrivivax sp.]
MLTCHLLDRADLKATEGQGAVITLIQRFGSAASMARRSIRKSSNHMPH